MGGAHRSWQIGIIWMAAMVDRHFTNVNFLYGFVSGVIHSGEGE